MTTIEKRKKLQQILDEHTVGGYWMTEDGMYIKESEMNDSQVSNLLDYIDQNNLIQHLECNIQFSTSIDLLNTNQTCTTTHKD